MRLDGALLDGFVAMALSHHELPVGASLGRPANECAVSAPQLCSKSRTHSMKAYRYQYAGVESLGHSEGLMLYLADSQERAL